MKRRTVYIWVGAIIGMTAMLTAAMIALSLSPEANAGVDGYFKSFYYTMNFAVFIITAGALIVALTGVAVSIRKPELEIRFYTPRGRIGGDSLTLHRNRDGRYGYGSSAPEDWSLYLYNHGNQTASNIKLAVRLGRGAYYYEESFGEWAPERFQYGMGCYEQAAVELDRRIRPEELAQVGRPPLHNAACTEDIQQEWIKIILWIDDEKPVAKKYPIRIIEDSGDN